LSDGKYTAKIIFENTINKQQQEVTVNLEIGKTIALSPSLIDSFLTSTYTLAGSSGWHKATDNNSMTFVEVARNNIGEAIFSLKNSGKGCTQFSSVQIYVGRTGNNALTGFCAEVGATKPVTGVYTSLGCDSTVDNGWLLIDTGRSFACGYNIKINGLTNSGGTNMEFGEVMVTND
jgi:hypothetical protein